jgi:predicted dehydrogenase
MMKKVRVAIVGSKFAAGLHAHAYAKLPHVEVVAAAAIDNLEPFCKANGIRKSYEDYREMLAHEDIDLLSVCVPNFLHKEVVLAAADAGKQIICEKPLATSLEDGELMVGICRKKGVKLMYAEDWLFAPALVRTKEIVDEGAIGDVLYVKAKETHPGSHSVYAQKVNYCGGGAMIHLGIHPIGWVRYFKGKEVVEVIGKSSGGGEKNLKHHHFEGEDWSVGLLTFEDGTYGFVEGNYTTVGGLDDIIEIYGTKGTMKIDLSKGSPITMFSLPGYQYSIEKAEIATGWSMPAVDEERNLGYSDEIAYFVDCVQRDAEPMFGVRGEDGLAALRIALAAYESSRTGATVKLKSPRK